MFRSFMIIHYQTLIFQYQNHVRDIADAMDLFTLVSCAEVVHCFISSLSPSYMIKQITMRRAEQATNCHSLAPVLYSTER